jgi:prepilin-type N-terminal cleavage/methylation domain-containing protein
MKNRAFPYLSILFQTHQPSKGFTLIELLIVVIIVGVLSSISLPMLSAKLKEDAQIAEAKAYIRQFAIQNQEAILTGAILENPPESENFIYSLSSFYGAKFIVASHANSNAQVFGLLKDSGQIITCKDDPEICLSN